MPEPLVLHLNHSNYSEIVLNSPKSLNSFNHSHVRSLSTFFKLCEDNNDVKFVILRGEGRAFCAGGDVREIMTVIEGDLVEFHCSSYEFHSFLNLMAGKKKPSICYMDGITVTFSQHSTFKIATENTVMSLPEGRIGHFCDGTNSFFMSRLDGYLGVYLALTGHQLKAEDVVFAGLATHFVPSSELEALGERLSQIQNITLDAIDSAIEEVAVKASHTPSQCTLFGEKLELIERCFKYETVEKIIEALKRESSKFAESCLKSMFAHCPLSLKLTLHVLHYGAEKPMSECINYEYRGWRTVPLSYNYREGVKSLLERRVPQWSPSKLEDIRDDDLSSSYFPPVLAVHPYCPEVDFMFSPHQKFLPPTRSEVRFIEISENLKSRKEIVNWFLKNRKFKFGTREIVQNILSRRNKEIPSSLNLEFTIDSKL